MGNVEPSIGQGILTGEARYHGNWIIDPIGVEVASRKEVRYRVRPNEQTASAWNFVKSAALPILLVDSCWRSKTVHSSTPDHFLFEAHLPMTIRCIFSPSWHRQISRGFVQVGKGLWRRNRSFGRNGRSSNWCRRRLVGRLFHSLLRARRRWRCQMRCLRAPGRKRALAGP